VNAAVHALDALIAILRPTLFALAAVLLVVAAVDWAVRTRRISPFSSVARFFRSTIDPLLAPVERRIVRSGGVPSHAPWYALGAVVVAGILLLAILGFIQGQLMRAGAATSVGAAGVVKLIVGWGFGILQIALLVYVVTSWIRISPYSPWVRWAHVLSEPILRPLRRVIPPIGGAIDITPLVAYFALIFIEGLVLGAL
jgi:YggT family protein